MTPQPLIPKIETVSERSVLGPNRTVQKAIVITYTVGAHGPFTLTTNQADINSGAARQQMQDFANSLALLPQ